MLLIRKYNNANVYFNLRMNAISLVAYFAAKYPDLLIEIILKLT